MRILCLGDVAISGNMDLSWPNPGGFTPGDEAKILFNWELPIGITLYPVPRSSGPRLLSHPNSVNVISKWAPGFAALATNHILDAGEEGLEATICALRRAGFQTVGAGLSNDEIEQPIIWRTEEGCLAIINWVFPETHPELDVVPGPNCWPGAEVARDMIKDLKDQADWVMVFAHWSDELFPYPRPEDRTIAKDLARAGADIIVGHHPHVVRGMEYFGTCPVYYSIGNFYFSDYRDSDGAWVIKQAPRNRESLGIIITFQKGLIPEFQVLSLWNTRARTKLDPMRRAARRMEQTSQPLYRIHAMEYGKWYMSERNLFKMYWAKWHFGIRRLGFQGLVSYALRVFHSRVK